MGRTDAAVRMLGVVLCCCVAMAGARRGKIHRSKLPGYRLRSATVEINADTLDNEVPVAYRPETVEPHQTWLNEKVEVTHEDMAEYRRRLADSSGSETWMNWETAMAADVVGPLRTAFVTNFFNGSQELLAAAEHCTVEGEVVTQSNLDSPNQDSGSGTATCDEDEVVGINSVAGTALAQIIISRLDWVEAYFRDTFQVKQAQSGITIQESSMDGYPFNGNPNGPTDDTTGDLLCDTSISDCPSAEYPDADLVIIVTMHPLSDDKSGIAGYALCRQTDQYGRCTVGYFNWVPSVIDVSSFLETAVIMNERATALHECLHVLGGIKNSRVFRDPETGEAQPLEYKMQAVPQSDYIAKQVAMWVTPGVVAMAQEEFNCSEITGMPLEDLPSGANGHWESRLMGSEVMSYGLTTGEYYVSRLTLQFFEDTFQYLVNFTAGTQRFYPATGADVADVQDIFSAIFADAEEAGDVAPNRTWAQGYQRWGRNAGCDFFNKYPSLETWGERYFCTEPGENACTADRRLSGKCLLYQYSSTTDYSAPSTMYTKTTISSGSVSTSNVDNTFSPNLPVVYRYLLEILDDSLSSGNYGGFLAAMDYAPVVTGYVNCQDDEPSAGNLKFNIDEVEFTGDDADWVDFSSGQTSLGGQIKSENSRCFISSLLAITRSYLAITDSTAFDLGGACYLFNCYQEDYLQIGVKTATQTATKWFRCNGNESLYIAGYIGSFKCPDPVEFCKYEDISGVKQTENNETLEWIFWGVLLGIILICFIIFCFCKKVRSCAAGRLKLLMNFHIPKEKNMINGKPQKTAASVFLTVISVIWVMIGIVSFGVGIVSLLDDSGWLWDGASALVFHFCGLGLVIIVLAVLGIMAGSADRPTLKATFYLYINMFMMIVFIFLSAIVLGVDEWLSVIVEVVWDNVYMYFPDSWLTLTSQEVWQRIWEWYEGSPWIVWTIVGWNAFSMVGGMICAFIMLTFRNVLGTMLFWMNALLAVAGVSYVVSCALLVPILEVRWLAALFLSGSLLVVIGAIGLFTCRRKQVVIIYLAAAAAVFIVVLVTGAFLFANVDENKERVSNLTDDDLAQVITNLEFIAQDWNTETFETFLSSNLTAAAVATLILAFLILAAMGAALLVLKDLVETEKEEQLQEAGHRQRKRKKKGSNRKREWERGSAETTNYNKELVKKASKHQMGSGTSRSNPDQGIEMQEVKLEE